MKIAAIAICALLLGACSSAPPREPLVSSAIGQRQLALIMSFMPGTFDSIDQDAGPGAGTRMRIAEFWQDRKMAGEHWLYVEHAKVGQDDKPFDQRIYRFVQSAGKYWAELYALPDKRESFVGEWRKPQPFAAYQPEGLREYRDCRLKMGQMTVMFWLGTEGKKCKAGNDAIAYELTSILANSAGMKEGTQGFDATGRQITGEAAVWEFRRISREPR